MAKGAKREKRDPRTEARHNWYRYHEAASAGHAEWVAKALRYDEFYAGDQWKDDDRKVLEDEGRPALTLNMVLSTVNAVIGEQLERKLEITFKPGRNGNENTAFALNSVAKAILNANHFEDVEERVFSDGIITDRGYFDIRMNFSKNLQGDVKISCEDGIDIVIDPEAKDMDPTTWNEVFIGRWMTPDEIGETYGWEKAEEVRQIAYTESYFREDNFDYFKRSFGGAHSVSRDNGDEAAKLRRVRVIERQHFELCEQWHFVDMETGDLRPVPYGTDKEEMERFANKYNLGLHKQKGRRVRQTISADDVLLSDDWSIYRSFTIVPYFPYFRRGKPFGIVKNLMDPQNLLNKTSSQELHIVNTTANSGWVVQEGSLVDMDQEDLESRGAETGLVLTYKRGYEPPEKIKPNSIPTGIDRISQKAANTIREISAINASMVGAARADQSGKAQEMSIGRSQVQVSVVLANLKRARRSVTKKILELVQDFYTETRYFKLVDNEMFGNAAEDEADVFINGMNDDGNILNDVTVGDYEIHIGHAPAGGTMQEVQMQEALGLRDVGVAIPDHFLVQYSNLAQKHSLVEFLKQSQGYGEPSEEEMELQSFQIEHQVATLRKELEMMDADIQLKLAQAKEKALKASTLEGYNQANMELMELQAKREEKQQELALRIALSARSHQNQNSLNDKRLSAQIAMKTLDHLSAKKNPQSQ